MRAWPLLAYAAVYAVTFVSLVRFEGISAGDPLFLLGIVGIGFSLLAWWATRGLTPRSAPVRAPRREGAAMVGYLAGVTVFITWGLPAVRNLVAPGWPAELLVLVAKLAVFVALPIGLWLRTFGYAATELFDIRAGLAGHWRPTVVMVAAVVLLQVVAGRARTDLAAAHPSPSVLAVALLAGFFWLLVDVGAVEEICFRGFLQTRLAAWANAELVGLVGATLLFGLAHAPGLFLRPELTGEPVGSHPSLLRAVGYSIVFTSVSGFFYGVLWLRTRNLWVVAVVHAAQDLLPTVAQSLLHGYFGA